MTTTPPNTPLSAEREAEIRQQQSEVVLMLRDELGIEETIAEKVVALLAQRHVLATRETVDDIRRSLRAPQLAPGSSLADRPRIVCLCGSTRFKDAFESATRKEGLAGRITLTVACFGHSGDLPPEACVDGHPTKTMLDTLHKRKIDLADEILVINVGGYIGQSTRSEIDYAIAHGKPVRYLESI